MGEKPQSKRKVSPNDKPSTSNASSEQLSPDTSSKISSKRSGKRAGRKDSSSRTAKPRKDFSKWLKYRSKGASRQDKTTPDKEDDSSGTPVKGKPPKNKAPFATCVSMEGLSAKELTPSCPPTKDIHAENVPSKDLPDKGITEDFPVEDLPVQHMSAKELPAEDMPPGVHHIEKLPGKDLSSEDAMAVDLPSRDTPVKEFPAKNLPAEFHPVETLPEEYLHTKDLPTAYLRAEDLPVEELPAEDFPPDVLVVKEFPVKDNTAENTLAASFSAEDAAATGLMGKELPQDQRPEKDFPNEVLPVKAPSTGTLSRDTEAKGHLMAVRFWGEDLPDGASDKAPGDTPGATVKGTESPHQKIMPANVASAEPAISSVSHEWTSFGHSGSDSEDVPLHNQKSNLALSVLKALNLPLDASQLPLSPMVEREQPPKNRRVSIDLRPTIEHLILTATRSDSDVTTLTSEPRHHPHNRDASATARSASGAPAARRWSFDDESLEKHVMVCPPALKVRRPSLADQQRALMELLAVRNTDSGSPTPDTGVQRECAHAWLGLSLGYAHDALLGDYTSARSATSRLWCT